MIEPIGYRENTILLVVILHEKFHDVLQNVNQLLEIQPYRSTAYNEKQNNCMLQNSKIQMGKICKPLFVDISFCGTSYRHSN